MLPRVARNVPPLDHVKDAAGSLRVQIEALLSMGLPNSPMQDAKIRVCSGNFVTARPLGVVNGIDFQHTGRVRRVDAEGIHHQLGDGSIVLVWTPGHAPGHQSVLITLPRSGRVLLTVDAAYTMDHWEEKALPGFLVSAVDAARSVRKLRALADKTDALVVTGHDPDAWPRFRHAPAFYD